MTLIRVKLITGTRSPFHQNIGGGQFATYVDWIVALVVSRRLKYQHRPRRQISHNDDDNAGQVLDEVLVANTDAVCLASSKLGQNSIQFDDY